MAATFGIESSVGDPWHLGRYPDPTTFFIDFKDAKQNLIFFSYNFSTGTSSSD